MTASESGRRRPVRIRWLIKGLGPGGAETLLVSLASRLDHARFQIDVDYLTPWKDHLVNDLRDAGARVTCLGARHPADLRWVGRFLRGIRSVDVVHVHSPLLAGIVRPIVRLLPNRPAIVSTEHNRWESFARVSRVLNRLTLPLDDATFAVADDVRASMGSHARRVETLVHGVDLRRISDTADDRAGVRRQLDIDGSRLLVLTIANLRANKAYPDLLHAARTVIDADDRIDFVAAGQGPLEDELRELHRSLELGDRFRFLGYRPHAYQLLVAADVFVLASHHEGYPVAAMEAMAAGKPIVATRVGGLVDAVREGVDGRLVAPQRPDELAAAILDVLGDPEKRAAMSTSARERSALFDIGRAADRHDELYSTLAAKRP